MTSAPSPRPISALRARMIEDMTVRGFNENTRSDYVRDVRAFAAFIGRSPATATAEDLRRFQRHVAPPACRGTSLPPSHRCRLGASEGACDAVDHAKITPSTAAATTNPRPRSSVRRRRPRPAHPLRTPPPRQIPIDGSRPTSPHGFLPGGLSDAGPQYGWIGYDRPASETLHHC